MSTLLTYGVFKMTYKTYKVRVSDNNYKSWYLNGTNYTKDEWESKLNPVKELSVKEISDLLGYEVKVVK